MQAFVPVGRAETQGRVPTRWRPTLAAIVAAFASGDFALSRQAIPDVDAVDALLSQQIRDYIADDGASLSALPPDAWATSVCIWAGHRWDVLVDLWTSDDGPSDMVLHRWVFEGRAGYRFQIRGVYVP